MRSVVLLGILTTYGWILLGLGIFAGDPPEQLIPLEKLQSGTKPKGENPGLPELKPLVPVDPGKKVKKNENPDDKAKPADGKLPKDPPMLDITDDKTKKEDPREVMARIASNLLSVKELLKNGKTGIETQKLHRKILDDLDKLLEQNKNKKKGSKGEKSQSKNKDQQDKNKKGGAKQPENGKGKGQKNQKDQGTSQAKAKSGSGKQNAKSQAKSKPDTQPGQAKSKKAKVQVAEAKMGEKDGKAMNLSKNSDKEAGGKQSTFGKLFKDVWGHFPKEKRMELDSYSNEQFMPRYEQLLRQYYSNIAKHSRGKKGE